MWQSGLICRVSGVVPDAKTGGQCQGFIRRSDDGSEAVVVNDIPDFPTGLLSPMLSLGWTANSPLSDVVENGVELRLTRSMQFPSPDHHINDPFQLVAEGKIKKEGDGIKTEMTVTASRKMDPITRHQLESIRAVLPFRETILDAATMEEIQQERERVLDASAKIIFLDSQNKPISANFMTKWSYGVGCYTVEMPITEVKVLDAPIFCDRRITWAQKAFRHITINASSIPCGALVAGQNDNDDEENREDNGALNGIDLQPGTSSNTAAN